MMRRLRIAAALLAALPLLGAVDPVPADLAPADKKLVQRKFFVETADDAAMLDTALAKAKAEGKLAVIVFGGDWCHDSRALAQTLTSGTFAREFGPRFAVTFIDVGVPQAGQGRNIDLVKRFGIKKLDSTPALFVISPKGKRLNSKKDALGWRNADSRGEAAILAWFRAFKAD
ncbi:thioredoxin family protein [Novosphingobium sp.]|uniref:thioredoxin family protein n=1 Tax=Novosphingobium sp. TaxID=1874826 RepID=UPI00286CE2AB|nr:thioredoxin family protein [Novosphingobium sp.]